MEREELLNNKKTGIRMKGISDISSDESEEIEVCFAYGLEARLKTPACEQCLARRWLSRYHICVFQREISD